jgi:hypothetical protein
MLPDFPSIRNEIETSAQLAIHFEMERQSPFAECQSFKQHEGSVHGYFQEGSEKEVLRGFHEISHKLYVKLSEIPNLVGDKFNAKLKEIADSLASQASKLHYSIIDEAVTETGNKIDVGGPFTAETYLDVMEMAEVNFKADGSQANKLMIHPSMGPTVKSQLMRLEEEPLLRKRYEKILSLKREDFRDRESRRKLVIRNK